MLKRFLNKYFGTKFTLNGGGLLKLKEDRRDLKFGSFRDWFGSYKPKRDSKTIKTISIKDQKRLSNCTFQAGAAAKEVDEGVVLSARYLTAKAYQLGLCGWEGWADLRSNQKVLQKFGCCEEKDCPSDSNLSFSRYIDVDFEKLDKLAAKHKIKSFWKIDNINEYLQAIDEGHPVVLGLDWFNGFNQGGGFKAPWIIRQIMGYYVGGHSFLGKGYKHIEKLVGCQNNYSGAWGNNGDFDISYDHLKKYIKKYGAYANLDIEYKKINAQDIIDKYNLKNIRGNISGTIYLIYNDKKFAYKNARVFVAYNGKPYLYKDAFTVVEQSQIDQIPYGGLLTENTGKYKDLVDHLKDPVNSNFKKE